MDKLEAYIYAKKKKKKKIFKKLLTYTYMHDIIMT